MSNPFQDNENIFDQQDDEFEDFPDVGAQRSFGNNNNQTSPFGASLDQFNNAPSQLGTMRTNSFDTFNTTAQPQAMQQFNQSNQQPNLPINNTNVKAQQKKLYLYAALAAVALFALIAIGVVVSNNLKTGETLPVQTTTTLIEPTTTQDNQGIQVQKKISASDVAGVANATDNIMVGRLVSKAPMLIEANQVICELEVELLNDNNDTVKIIVPSYLYYELALNDKVDINLRFGKAVDGTEFWTVYGIKKH